MQKEIKLSSVDIQEKQSGGIIQKNVDRAITNQTINKKSKSLKHHNIVTCGTVIQIVDKGINSGELTVLNSYKENL